MSASAVLTWQPGQEQRLKFYLHRNLRVSAVEGAHVAGFYQEQRAYTFAPEAVT
jgi:hypothetical protein